MFYNYCVASVIIHQTPLKLIEQKMMQDMNQETKPSIKNPTTWEKALGQYKYQANRSGEGECTRVLDNLSRISAGVKQQLMQDPAYLVSSG